MRRIGVLTSFIALGVAATMRIAPASLMDTLTDGAFSNYSDWKAIGIRMGIPLALSVVSSLIPLAGKSAPLTPEGQESLSRLNDARAVGVLGLTTYATYDVMSLLVEGLFPQGGAQPSLLTKDEMAIRPFIFGVGTTLVAACTALSLAASKIGHGVTARRIKSAPSP